MQMMLNVKGNNEVGDNPPNKRHGGDRHGTTGKPCRTCGVCGKTNVMHKDDDCFTLEKNKDKRPSYWRTEWNGVSK